MLAGIAVGGAALDPGAVAHALPPARIGRRRHDRVAAARSARRDRSDRRSRARARRRAAAGAAAQPDRRPVSDGRGERRGRDHRGCRDARRRSALHPAAGLRLRPRDGGARRGAGTARPAPRSERLVLAGVSIAALLSAVVTLALERAARGAAAKRSSPGSPDRWPAAAGRSLRPPRPRRCSASRWRPRRSPPSTSCASARGGPRRSA